MTKKQWNGILKELQSFRLKYSHEYPILYKDYEYADSYVPIERVDTTYGYIRLPGRKYIKHSDVLHITPKKLKTKFFTKINVFEMEKL